MKKYIIALFIISFTLLGCHLPGRWDGGSLQYRGRTVYWAPEDIPLVLFIDDSMPTTHIEATLDAASEWNDNLGLVVFDPVIWNFQQPLPVDHGMVVVSMRELGRNGTYIVNGLHKGVFYGNQPRRKFSMVWFDDDLEDNKLYRVMLHELGHALTLSHDYGDCRSIMHPMVTTCGDGVSILPEDRERILRMIAGRVATSVLIFP